MNTLFGEMNVDKQGLKQSCINLQQAKCKSD